MADTNNDVRVAAAMQIPQYVLDHGKYQCLSTSRRQYSERNEPQWSNFHCRKAARIKIEDDTKSYITNVPPAPLLHLHSKDPYRPSSIAAQLANTTPKFNFIPVPIPNAPLTLDNLDQLNTIGGKDIYLTSNDDITTNPKWLEGEKDWTNGEKSGAIVVVDKGEGVVDAFYFYFFAFNWGGVVLEKQLGDHVGDWYVLNSPRCKIEESIDQYREHNMIRFINGEPKYIWLSQHANGEAFTFAALKKDASGKRVSLHPQIILPNPLTPTSQPIIFCATGSHALYPTAGKTDHTIPNLNLSTPFLLVDYTDAGPLYDPLLCSFLYSYTSDTFTPYTPTAPTSYLSFTGRWGDEEYPANDPRQKGKNLLTFKKYTGGPTGPADKQLMRKDVWPQNSSSGGQRIRTSVDGSSWFRDLFGRMKMKKAGVRRVDVRGEEVGFMAGRFVGGGET